MLKRLLPILIMSLIAVSSPAFAQSGAWVQYYEAAQRHIAAGRFDDAEYELKEAMPIAQELGSSDPRYAFTVGNLGRVYVAQNKFTEAEPLLLKAVDLLQRCDYKEQELADFCLAYQDLLIKTGKKDDALQVNEAIKRMVAQKMEVQRQSASAWQTEYDAGKKDYENHKILSAEVHLLKSLQVAEQEVGAIEERKNSLTALFALYREERNYKQLDAYFPRLETAIAKLKGPNSASMADLFDEYSALLAQQKRFTESADYRRKADAIYHEVAATSRSDAHRQLAASAHTSFSHFNWNNNGKFRSPLYSTGDSWDNNSFNWLDASFDNILLGPGLSWDAQMEAMRQSYFNEANVVAQTERNMRALESRQLQLQILRPSYMSRYHH